MCVSAVENLPISWYIGEKHIDIFMVDEICHEYRASRKAE